MDSNYVDPNRLGFLQRDYNVSDLGHAGVKYEAAPTRNEWPASVAEYIELEAEREMKEARAKAIAQTVQLGIGEAYRNPFTLNAALQAARIALELTQITLEGEK